MVGIGLNVHMCEMPEPIQSTATSLALLNCRIMDREILLAAILQGIETRAALWQANGFEKMASEIGQCDALLGRRIFVDGVEGYGAGIDVDGALLLQRVGDSKPTRILSGTVRLLE